MCSSFGRDDIDIWKSLQILFRTDFMIDGRYRNFLLRAINNYDCSALPTAATNTLTERPITPRNLPAIR